MEEEDDDTECERGFYERSAGPGISFFSAGRSGENFGEQWEMAWHPDFALNIAHKTGCDFFFRFDLPNKTFFLAVSRAKRVYTSTASKRAEPKGGKGENST